MSNKFHNVKIEELTDTECRELLNMIKVLVGEMPSFIEYNRDGGYGRTGDPYACCCGYTNEGHDKDCSVWQIEKIFGY